MVLFEVVIEDAAAHRVATADADGLQLQRVVIIQVVNGDGEADDGFAVDGYYAAAVAELQFRVLSSEFQVIGTRTDSLRYIKREFGCAFNMERIQLPVHCLKKRFGFGEFFDCHDACVERGRGLERARDWEAEANLVAADVQALACERQHVAVMVRGNAQGQFRVLSSEFRVVREVKIDQARGGREAANQLNTEPINSMESWKSS